MAITTYQEAREKFPDSIILLRTESGQELIRQTAYLLIRKADEHMDEELCDTAINLIGIEACVAYKLNHDLELTKQDKEYILKMLKDGE